MPEPLFLLTMALVLDAVLGDMDWLFRRVPHPVVLVGTLIGFLDRRLNRRGAAAQLVRGAIVVVFVVALSAGAGWAIHYVAIITPHGWLAELALVAILLAQRGLYAHVRNVAQALAKDGVTAGRAAVAHIVGRDVSKLDTHGVARAAIETLAENFADGVVAPIFLYALLGLPGLCAYKAINTMDSMIGYKSAQYKNFGMTAARLDDAVNWIPARLSGTIIVLAAAFAPTAHPTRALRVLRTDSRNHDSPNAGWPEAAMAGALNVALGGPRTYDGGVSKSQWMGDGDSRATVDDIRRALVVFTIACMLNGLIVACLAIVSLK
jgi:adenosylcobinamide-phosphate synthase